MLVILHEGSATLVPPELYVLACAHHLLEMALPHLRGADDGGLCDHIGDAAVPIYRL